MVLPTAFWLTHGLSRSCGAEADKATTDPTEPPPEVVETVMFRGVCGAVARGGIVTAAAFYPRIVTLGSLRGPTWSAASSTDVAPMPPSFGHDTAGAYRGTALALTMLPAIIAAVAPFTRKPRRPRMPTGVRSTPAALKSSGARVGVTRIAHIIVFVA